MKNNTDLFIKYLDNGLSEQERNSFKIMLDEDSELMNEFNEQFQHSDLNCLKFFQSNELREVQQELSNELISPKAITIENQSE